MKTKTILLGTVAMTLSGCNMHSSMYESSGPRYTPRPEIAQNNYTATNHTEDSMDKKSYKQYEQREPCQNYRELPRNMIDKCASVEEEMEPATTQMAKHGEQKALPIVSSYTVLFDHDKSDIRANEMATIDRSMQEISKYNPSQVTVTGYTDSSGEAGYNQALSREREQAVSKALLSRGIESQVLEREARGEYDQAVETKDGIRKQDNRRAVIDFRR